MLHAIVEYIRWFQDGIGVTAVSNQYADQLPTAVHFLRRVPIHGHPNPIVEADRPLQDIVEMNTERLSLVKNPAANWKDLAEMVAAVNTTTKLLALKQQAKLKIQAEVGLEVSQPDFSFRDRWLPDADRRRCDPHRIRRTMDI